MLAAGRVAVSVVELLVSVAPAVCTSRGADVPVVMVRVRLMPWVAAVPVPVMVIG